MNLSAPKYAWITGNTYGSNLTSGPRSRYGLINPSRTGARNICVARRDCSNAPATTGNGTHEHLHSMPRTALEAISATLPRCPTSDASSPGGPLQLLLISTASGHLHTSGYPVAHPGGGYPLRLGTLHAAASRWHAASTVSLLTHLARDDGRLESQASHPR
jgi:hypothetical protein